MGWSDGSELAGSVWKMFKKFVPKENREYMAKQLYDLFCDYDADDWNENSLLYKDANIKSEEE